MLKGKDDVFLNPEFFVDGKPVTEPLTKDAPNENQPKSTHLLAYRRLRDPRTIKLLDPACGSMHFGLYAFDLFEIIYAEAWDLNFPFSGSRGAGGNGLKPLRETYASKDAYLRDIPRLIIEHNLHGIDIDPRAVQIAGLSLWLRAQRSWQQQKLRPQDRPSIHRSNIVCAEPMPGEKAFLDEFIAAPMKHFGNRPKNVSMPRSKPMPNRPSKAEATCAVYLSMMQPKALPSLTCAVSVMTWR